VVVGKEKASKNTYQGIIVADISGKASARASEIATTLGGTMSAFPAEELVPGEADIVVVIGNTPTSMSVDTNGQSNTILDTSKNRHSARRAQRYNNNPLFSTLLFTSQCQYFALLQGKYLFFLEAWFVTNGVLCASVWGYSRS
jgi:hypothetical protein